MLEVVKSGHQQRNVEEQGKELWHVNRNNIFSQGRSNVMKVDSFDCVRGVCYIPTYATDFREAWVNFDTKVVDRELGIAKRIGFNAIRIWLHYHAYMENPKEMVENVERFLKLCDKYEFKVMLALFNNDGLEWDLRSPGPDKLGKENWPQYEKYMQGIISPHIGDDRIMMWEIMNEPFIAPILLNMRSIWEQDQTTVQNVIRLLEAIPENDKKTILDFLKHCYSCLKSVDKNSLITIGVARSKGVSFVDNFEDIISFHSYEANPESLKAELTEMKNKAKSLGKPVLLTEWGSSISSRPLAVTSGEQLQYYERIMSVVMQAEIGWFIWSLMIGIEPYAFQGLVHMNGVERPAVKVVRNFLMGK